MRALIVALVATTALTAACSGEPSVVTAPTPTTGGVVATDAYTALAPPTSPGVGSFDAAFSRRAHETARGLLTLTLGEKSTLSGTGTTELLERLDVPEDALDIGPLLRPPSRKGLGIRPLLARTVQLTGIEVVRSSYQADEVRGASGESGLRITWDGSVRYRVTQQGAGHEVAYALRISYVFAPLPPEPNGLQLVQVVPGAWHAAPVVGSCLDEGVLVPSEGVPTEADFARGPWPSAPAGPPCPV